MRVVRLCILFVAILPAQGPRCEMFQVTGWCESRNDQPMIMQEATYRKGRPTIDRQQTEKEE